MNTIGDQLIKFLPFMLAEVARAAGINAAIKLGEEWGGTKRYIPAEPKPGHAICRLIGMRGTLALVERWGGAHHDIPRPTLTMKKLEILKHTGTSREVANDCKCTERWVRRVRAEFFGSWEERHRLFGGGWAYKIPLTKEQRDFIEASNETPENIAIHLGVSEGAVRRHRRKHQNPAIPRYRLSQQDKASIAASSGPAEVVAATFGCAAATVRKLRRLARKQAEAEGSKPPAPVHASASPHNIDANAPLTGAVGASRDRPPRPHQGAVRRTDGR